MNTLLERIEQSRAVAASKYKDACGTTPLDAEHKEQLQERKLFWLDMYENQSRLLFNATGENRWIEPDFCVMPAVSIEIKEEAE